MLFTSDELEKVISQLNSLLMEGYLFKDALKADFRIGSSVPGFNVEDFKQKKDEQFENWFQKISHTIDSLFQSNSHYLFHFLNTTYAGNVFAGSLPLNISELVIRYEAFLNSLEEIIIRLEEKENLQVRKEIAEQEQGADMLYKITYNEHKRQVKLNNIVLARTDFDSENDNAFQHIYLNANRTVTKEEIEKSTGTKLQKRLTDIVRDLGFTGNLRAIFFPAVTKTELMFINPIGVTISFRDFYTLRPLPRRCDSLSCLYLLRKLQYMYYFAREPLFSYSYLRAKLAWEAG